MSVLRSISVFLSSYADIDSMYISDVSEVKVTHELTAMYVVGIVCYPSTHPEPSISISIHIIANIKFIAKTVGTLMLEQTPLLDKNKHHCDKI